ncbi:MAG: GNAT family N-acetyltransferase [Pseudomonadales bacterium]|nr:GNAT family N-acetyltransferase [Pseudomonadales bacterium]
MTSLRFTHRVAEQTDVPDIIKLMQLSIEENMKAFLSREEIEAAKETMGVDQTLIDDGTYFLIEAEVSGKKVLVGCGGWGKRRTLYGGNHTKGRDDSFSDPATEAARIRAMYTHPEWTRKGIGSLLIKLGEDAARAAGFSRMELGSTVAGEALYLAKGYREVSRENHIGENGSDNLVIKMEKPL